MKGLVTRGLAVASSFALVATMAACNSAPPAEPEKPYVAPQGVTETEILLGSHQPLTGPAAPGYSKIAPATKAYFDYVNATAGGVHGRKITYKYLDDTYNPATTVTLVKQLIEQDKVFAILNGLGTPTHTGVLDTINGAKIPDLFVASGAIAWDNKGSYPGTFAYQTDYVTEGKILGEYIKKTFAGKKVCHLGQQDDFGRDALTGLEKGLGAAVAEKQTYVTNPPTVTAQVGALKAAGCEVVALATIPAFTALTLGAAAAASWKPQFVASGVGGDYTTLLGRLTSGAPTDPAKKAVADALLEGFVTTGYLPAVQDASNPWITLFKGINEKYNAGQEFDGNILYGMSVGYLTVQALLAAGKNLTVDGLIKAIEDGGAKWRGPGLVPYGFSKDSHAGLTGVRIGSIKGGTQSYITPAYVTDKQNGAVKEYTEAPITPPDKGIPTV